MTPIIIESHQQHGKGKTLLCGNRCQREIVRGSIQLKRGRGAEKCRGRSGLDRLVPHAQKISLLEPLLLKPSAASNRFPLRPVSPHSHRREAIFALIQG